MRRFAGSFLAKQERGRHNGEKNTGQRFVSHPVAAPSSGQGWFLSSMHMMDLHCLAGHKWVSLTWPYRAPARPCAAGIVASHVCQCPGGLWLFDTALGKVVHPRNREGILEHHVNLAMSRA